MKRQLAFGICLLTLASFSLACRISITPTPSPTQPPTITPTITQTPVPTQTPTPTATATPPLSAYSGPALLELRMFSTMRGWGLTENQILVTRDGGIRWAQVPLPGGLAYNPSISAHFIDADIAYFFVSDTVTGQLLATRDNGATWETSTTPFNNAQISFSSDNNGFALQTLSSDNEQMSVAIYQTLDRGKTWIQVFDHTDNPGEQNLPINGIKTGVAFIDSSQGFIGLREQTNDVGLYHAQDAGRNWVKEELALPDQLDKNNYQSTVWPPFFLKQNDKDGFLPVDFVAASGATTRVFYRTDDAGITWQKGEEIPEGTTYFFSNAQTGWVWSKNTIYLTADGAKTWQASPIAFGRTERAKLINFVDPQNGWLITIDAKNTIHKYRSNDGGGTWTAVIN